MEAGLEEGKEAGLEEGKEEGLGEEKEVGLGEGRVEDLKKEHFFKSCRASTSD